MFLPGKDPDPQFFGNPDKLLSSRFSAAGEQYRLYCHTGIFPSPDS
jgi:hypothetical protein